MQLKSMIRENLFNELLGKKILIWGARMTGIGALRQLKMKENKIKTKLQEKSIQK